MKLIVGLGDADSDNRGHDERHMTVIVGAVTAHDDGEGDRRRGGRARRHGAR